MSTCNNGNCPDTKECDTNWELTKSRDSCFINDRVEEALNIAGADLNVFKLLGVHEQGKLIDLADNGAPLSGGSISGFPPENAYQNNNLEWRSLQKGTGVVTTSYIGYDFGEIKLENGRDQYGVDTKISHTITTVTIQQSSQSQNRITKARLERSDDGIQWFGVGIVDIPDNDQENTISIKRGPKANKFRLRPLAFNGGTNDHWVVKKLQLIEYAKTDIGNVQDYIFLENRNRDYADEPTAIKGSYELVDLTTELTKFGIDMPGQSFYFTISFSHCIDNLSRPLVIGDIIEIPSQTQYSATMEPIKKFVEVTDVTWDTQGFTPGWKPTLYRVTAQPALATEETQDVFGDLVPEIDGAGFMDVDASKYVDLSDPTQEIVAEARDAVPERGVDTADIRHFDVSEVANARTAGYDISSLNPNPTDLFVEDGLPPNGEKYTESDTFPSTPVDKAYHRLTYTGLAKDIPPRLFRWSTAKNRWIYIETDRRMTMNSTKPSVEKALTADNVVPNNKIGV